MNWSRLVILLLAACRIKSESYEYASGSGLEQAEDIQGTSRTQETVLNEITEATYPDTFEYQISNRNPLSTTPRSGPCELQSNCGITESPLPTQVLSLDITEDAEAINETSKETKERVFINIDQVQNNFQENLIKIERDIEKTMRLVVEKVDRLEKMRIRESVGHQVESRFNDKLEKLDGSIRHILEALAAISHSNSNAFQEQPADTTETLSTTTTTTQRPHERFDLVATETWSYIDSKFTELKAKLLDANERMKRDLENKMKEVLQKYENIGDDTSKLKSMKETTLKNLEDSDMTGTTKRGNDQGRNFNRTDQDLSRSHVKHDDNMATDSQSVEDRKDSETYRSTTKTHFQASWATTVPPENQVVKEYVKSEARTTKTPASEDSISDQIPEQTPSILHTINTRYQERGSQSRPTNEKIPDEESNKRSVEIPNIFLRERIEHLATNEAQLTGHSSPKISEKDHPKHCADIYQSGNTRSGVYRINPQKGEWWKAYCDMETDGGGWTVIQRRTFGNVNFSRGWEDYKNGFGSMTGEFWLGLEKMHILTQNRRHRRGMSLRIDLKDWSDVEQFARYRSFKISSEQQKYKLYLKDYHGTAGNALQYGTGTYNHNHQSFTTWDKDNDNYHEGNCGAYYESGWWFNSCFAANLNGKYYRGTYNGVRNGIYWGTWYKLNDAQTNSRHSFKYVDMKIRPENFRLKDFKNQ